MATTRIMPLHVGKGRTVDRAISAIIDYMENPAKTDGGQLITSFACNSRLADAEFLYAKQPNRSHRQSQRTDQPCPYHQKQHLLSLTTKEHKCRKQSHCATEKP